jgi:putative Mn2+ efflux pump MntP
LPPRERLRLSLVLSSVEMAMPVVGVLLGRGFGVLVGAAADWVAIEVLGALGVWMVVHDEEGESERVVGLRGGSPLVLFALGLSAEKRGASSGQNLPQRNKSTWSSPQSDPRCSSSAR